MTKYDRFRSLRLGCVGVLVDTIRINVACDYLNDDLVELLLICLLPRFCVLDLCTLFESYLEFYNFFFG